MVTALAVRGSSLLRKLALIIATGGHAGYIPIAPGTGGSALGLVLFSLVRVFGRLDLEFYLVVVVFGLGIWSSTVATRHFGDEDPSVVVIDEVVGMLITLLWVPVGWFGVMVGFVAFRAFDIIKPFPTSSAERLPGGWGIMIDDVIAGIYAQMSIRLLGWLVPSLFVAVQGG